MATQVPTIGFNDETVDYKSSCFMVWDVGGQDKIRPVRRHHCKGTNDLICVVDSNDREMIEDAKEDCRVPTGAVHSQDL